MKRLRPTIIGSVSMPHHGVVRSFQDVRVDERYPHEPFLDRVWQLRANVGAYDAVYVALAEALSTVLVTGDRRLAGTPGVNAEIEPI